MIGQPNLVYTGSYQGRLFSHKGVIKSLINVKCECLTYCEQYVHFIPCMKLLLSVHLQLTVFISLLPNVNGLLVDVKFAVLSKTPYRRNTSTISGVWCDSYVCMAEII